MFVILTSNRSRYSGAGMTKYRNYGDNFVCGTVATITVSETRPFYNYLAHYLYLRTIVNCRNYKIHLKFFSSGRHKKYDLHQCQVLILSSNFILTDNKFSCIDKGVMYHSQQNKWYPRGCQNVTKIAVNSNTL